MITSFENVVVPGLLQTADYMRALMVRTPVIPALEIPERVKARLNRQRVLDRRYPAKFVFFLDEYALSRTGAGREIMSEQVHHLLRMTVRPNVESQTSVLFLERLDTIHGYNRIVATLASVALDEEDSRAWLATLATELGAPREDHDEHATTLEEEFPQ